MRLKNRKSRFVRQRWQQIYNVLTEGHNTAPDFTIDSIHELRPHTK